MARARYSARWYASADHTGAVSDEGAAASVVARATRVDDTEAATSAGQPDEVAAVAAVAAVVTAAYNEPGEDAASARPRPSASTSAKASAGAWRRAKRAQAAAAACVGTAAARSRANDHASPAFSTIKVPSASAAKS